MTSTTAQPAAPAQQQSRRLILASAIAVASISTVAAYLAMVGFGTDVIRMTPWVAYSCAGVFELSLVTVALMAREATQHNRPAHTLLTLTWILSATSGTFAAFHELHQGHGIFAAGFRMCVPILAALMWHLALIGDKHLATGRTWSQLRAGARMHAAFEAVEDHQRAHDRHADPETGGTTKTRRQLDKAEARMRRAARIARRTVDPADMAREITAYAGAFQSFAAGVTTVQQLQHHARPAGTHPDQATDQAAAPAQLAPTTNPAAAVLALQAPAAAPADVSPAEPASGATEAVTAPVEPVQAPERPHLVTVPTEPAEGERRQTAPEPAAPTRSSTDTSSTAELALQAAALRADGHKVAEIARRLNVSSRSVYRWTKAS